MRRIVYVQYTNPAAYPSLEHSSRLLGQAGWRVVFLGTGDSTGGSMRFSPHPNIAVQRLPFCPEGWRQKFHYLFFCIWVGAWVFCCRPQWIYASDPLSCPVALMLSYCLRVIYHEHDSPDFSSEKAKRKTVFMRIVFWARRKLAERAQLCIFPNRQRADRFSAQTGRKEVLCVWNCPAREEISPQRSIRPGDDLWVLYHGSIVPNRIPLEVIEALALLPESVKLRVIGYETVGHRGYLQQMRELSRKIGVATRVEFVGTLPRRELFEFCRRSDVGLAFMPPKSNDVNESTMTGASNKPFEYLACGLALLVSYLPDWRKVYVEPGYGLACDPGNPESIVQALRWFLEHPEQRRAMGEQGRQRILTEWNYECQFAPVLEQLERGKR